MSETLNLLQKYYPTIDLSVIPIRAGKASWVSYNKCGFLHGLILYGRPEHVSILHTYLQKKEFKEIEEEFIDEMFEIYIYPFKQHTGSRCQTANQPKRESGADMNGSQSGSSVFKMEEMVKDRDGWCLVCWDNRLCQCCHIIAQKNASGVSVDIPSVLQRAGLTNIHQVQNGMLLCVYCHKLFDTLQMYVDVDERGRMWVKVVDSPNGSNDLEFMNMPKRIQILRELSSEYIQSDRPVEEKGQLGIYFMSSDESLFPNVKALEMHKTACLIWRMAGGAESDDDYYSSDDDAPNDAIKVNESPIDLKTRIEKWSSSVTLSME